MLSKPFDLRVELFRSFNTEKITTQTPKFSWVIPSMESNLSQTDFHLLVSMLREDLERHIGTLWDTKRIKSDQSLHVAYAGGLLKPSHRYYWKVKIWGNEIEESPWSDIHTFETAESFCEYNYPEPKLMYRDCSAVSMSVNSSRNVFYDFGKAVFGTVVLKIKNTGLPFDLIVHLGEAVQGNNSIHRAPSGTIRYRQMIESIATGEHEYIVRIPSDSRNTGKDAIQMPSDAVEVLPFRFCELENLSATAEIVSIDQRMYAVPFDDSASKFECSDIRLTKVWDLCKHTIHATTFCGYYVDGDRERIPYEADAYINQLSHYATDAEYAVARRTHEYLIQKPTWPTEWILHSILIAWADYWFTGDKESLQKYYEDLKHKSLVALSREDGLISTKTGLVTGIVMDAIHLAGRGELQDIVDWPAPHERDHYDMVAINTVVNCFYYKALVIIKKIAAVLQRTEDEIIFHQYAKQVYQSINEKLFDSQRGIYIDGEGSSHASFHANVFALAFDLVPEENKLKVIAYIVSRDMACSVYGAQYLLEALYRNRQADHALRLMSSEKTRGWLNMIQKGSTMTMEAWDLQYKKNLDWNHAWGTAPANIIANYLMGIYPAEAGYRKVRIDPQLGSLTQASITLPTIRGSIVLQITSRGKQLCYEIVIPSNMQAEVLWPQEQSNNDSIYINQKLVRGKLKNERLSFAIGSGHYLFEWLADT